MRIYLERTGEEPARVERVGGRHFGVKDQNCRWQQQPTQPSDPSRALDALAKVTDGGGPWAVVDGRAGETLPRRRRKRTVPTERGRRRHPRLTSAPACCASRETHAPRSGQLDHRDAIAPGRRCLIWFGEKRRLERGRKAWRRRRGREGRRRKGGQGWVGV